MDLDGFLGPFKGTVRTPSVALGPGYRLQTAHLESRCYRCFTRKSVGLPSYRGRKGLQPHLPQAHKVVKPSHASCREFLHRVLGGVWPTPSVEQGGVYSIYYKVLYSLPEGGLWCVSLWWEKEREKRYIHSAHSDMYIYHTHRVTVTAV